MGQTIAESIWEEGRLKGRAEGEQEGELKALRRTLRRLLTARFGVVPEAIAARVESCGDVERLTAAIVRMSDIATPDELEL